MGDNEAYLDSLLKSMNGAEETTDTVADTVTDTVADTVTDAVADTGNRMMTPDEIAAMFATMEQSTPEEPESIIEQGDASFEETFEDSMELPQDLLNDLLQKFEEQEAADNSDVSEEIAEKPETIEEPMDILAEIAKMEDEIVADFSQEEVTDNYQLQEGYTTENTQNMSAEEIEQLLAETQQFAENEASENTYEFSDNEATVDDMSNEDLLELLGGLDTHSEPGEANSFEEAETSFLNGLQENAERDVMSDASVAERTKERKERKKKEKQEKQAAKKALKEATKEAKKAAKEAKKQQAQRQKLAQEEMVLEEVALEDAISEQSVATESVLDLFADSEAKEETVSIFDLTSVVDPDGDNGVDTQAEVVMLWDEPDENEEVSENASKGKKSRKAKKQKDTENKKKDGFFGKVFAFLTEEDEEPAAEDENQSILDELAAEDKEAEKKKKGKTAKGKKGKGNAESEDGEKPDKKKEKKKKNPKPKKVKEIKIKPIEEERPSKRVSTKSVAVIVAFAATVLGVILFATSYFSELLHRNDAKEAFNRMDYASCYAGLYGMDLSEEEQEMLKHAELVLRMQRHIELYATYHEDEKELEALDSLMQAVAEYEDLYAKALDCGAGPEVAVLYEDVLEILQTSYGISQEEAHIIAACESNVEYTRYLTALIGGDGGVTMPDEGMQDVLPEEEELLNPDFAD